MAPRWPRLAAAAFGFVWFLLIGGLPTLNPRNVEFLMVGDWFQHWLGWLFFRNEPWTFPLGAISSLPYPVGTNIGFTDSNPLVSLVLKPFSSWLPAEFQFIGPWLALCFVLQGYAGAALTSTVTKDSRQQFLGGCFFVMSSVLAARLGHDTLCAHWVLLGLLYVGLKLYDDQSAVRRGAMTAASLAILAASIHPYLAAMSWVLAQAVFARLWRARLIRLSAAFLAMIATTAGMLVVFGVIGYFGKAGMGSTGFGAFSADMLALIDPRDYSRLLPGFPLTPEQHEGFGFVGLGGLFACALAVFAYRRVRPKLSAGTPIVLVACGLMSFYALSEDVTLGGTQVARMHSFYDNFETLTNSFRASGRFVWSIHYLALLAGIWGVTRFAGATRQWVGTGLLSVILLLQGFDLRMPLWGQPRNFRQASAELEAARGQYQHMEIYPMQVLGVSSGDYPEDHVNRYMLAAYRLGVTFNSGIFARLPHDRLLTEFNEQRRRMEAGQLDPQTIYVVTSAEINRVKERGGVCGRFDGDWICVSRDSDEVFRTLVETGRLIERKLR